MTFLELAQPLDALGRRRGDPKISVKLLGIFLVLLTKTRFIKIISFVVVQRRIEVDVMMGRPTEVSNPHLCAARAQVDKMLLPLQFLGSLRNYSGVWYGNDESDHAR